MPQKNAYMIDLMMGEGRIDLLVEHKIIVELKAVEAIAPILQRKYFLT